MTAGGCRRANSCHRRGKQVQVKDNQPRHCRRWLNPSNWSATASGSEFGGGPQSCLCQAGRVPGLC